MRCPEPGFPDPFQIKLNYFIQVMQPPFSQLREATPPGLPTPVMLPESSMSME
jgi:hypothetical protein